MLPGLLSLVVGDLRMSHPTSLYAVLILPALHKSFFVINGDTFFDINIRDLELEIKKNSSDVGVALVKLKLHHKQYNYKINKQNTSIKININSIVFFIFVIFKKK